MSMMTHFNNLCNKPFALPLEEVAPFILCASSTLAVDEMHLSFGVVIIVSSL